jgi:hypothetical protein
LRRRDMKPGGLLVGERRQRMTGHAVIGHHTCERPVTCLTLARDKLVRFRDRSDYQPFPTRNCVTAGTMHGKGMPPTIRPSRKDRMR